MLGLDVGDERRAPGSRRRQTRALGVGVQDDARALRAVTSCVTSSPRRSSVATVSGPDTVTSTSDERAAAAARDEEQRGEEEEQAAIGGQRGRSARATGS